MNPRGWPAGPGGPGDEGALLTALRARSPAAFEVMVRSYGGAMLAAARRLLRTEEDARDAVQDAFLSAFRYIHDFQGEAKLSTWLHRIAINAALLKLRTQKRKREQPIEELLPTFAEDGHTEHSAAEWRSVEDALQRRQLCGLMRRCIDELPESYRTVLILRDIEDMDTQQTAELLGLSSGAVKVRLHRARMALLKLLDPHLRNGNEP